MKKRNIVWSCILVSLLTFATLFVLFAKEKEKYVLTEGRLKNNFIMPTIENISNGEFQDTFESAYKDKFFGRESFIKVNNRIDSFFYYITSRTHTPYTLYKVGNNIFRFDAGEEYLLEFPIIRNTYKEEDIVNAANNINSLSYKYSDINFYVYDCFRLNMVDWFDQENDITSYGVKNNDIFHKSLDNRIKYYSYYPKNIDEYQKYFFKTDPHWNTYGSYELGYKKIVDMINDNYHDLQYLVPIGEFSYEDHPYYGQYGRGSMYFTSPDIFIDLKFDLPKYITLVNGLEKKYDYVEEFETWTVDEYRMPYIYSNIHGNDEKEVVYDFNTNNGRVLLAFVDSYASPIKYLIASHFENAVFIDLRLYPDFNIDQYIKDYGVTDILFLEYYGTLYNPDYIINID